MKRPLSRNVRQPRPSRTAREGYRKQARLSFERLASRNMMCADCPLETDGLEVDGTGYVEAAINEAAEEIASRLDHSPPQLEDIGLGPQDEHLDAIFGGSEFELPGNEMSEWLNDMFGLEIGGLGGFDLDQSGNPLGEFGDALDRVFGDIDQDWMPGMPGAPMIPGGGLEGSFSSPAFGGGGGSDESGSVHPGGGFLGLGSDNLGSYLPQIDNGLGRELERALPGVSIGYKPNQPESDSKSDKEQEVQEVKKEEQKEEQNMWAEEKGEFEPNEQEEKEEDEKKPGGQSGRPADDGDGPDTPFTNSAIGADHFGSVFMPADDGSGPNTPFTNVGLASDVASVGELYMPNPEEGGDGGPRSMAATDVGIDTNWYMPAPDDNGGTPYSNVATVSHVASSYSVGRLRAFGY